jgi:hypothetical protein
VREALASLPWVDKGSVETNFSTKQARFTIADPKVYNEQQLRAALPERFSITKINTKIKQAG